MTRPSPSGNLAEERANKIHRIQEGAAKSGFSLAAIIAIGLLIAIIIYLFSSGVPFMASYGADFFFGTSWNMNSQVGPYGILKMFCTTLYLTAFSSALGGFFGLFVAIALFAFVPHSFVKPIKALIELLAGIPSVIFGLFGEMVIVPWVREAFPVSGNHGMGILSAGIVLLIMILPTMVSISYNALCSVDPLYLEGAMALGSSKPMAVFKIVVPAAKRGILAALVLSTGRALGETMAVAMVIGGSANSWPGMLRSCETLTAVIARTANEATGTDFDALVACACILFILSFLINLFFSFLESEKKDKKKSSRKARRHV